MSQGNKKITTRKIPATNNKVLFRTGSLRFFKKYRQPIIKLWSVPVPARETVRLKFVIHKKVTPQKLFYGQISVYSEKISLPDLFSLKAADN